jgi:hypothetical protein
MVYLMTAISIDFRAAKIWGGSVNNEMKNCGRKPLQHF